MEMEVCYRFDIVRPETEEHPVELLGAYSSYEAAEAALEDMEREGRELSGARIMTQESRRLSAV